MSERTPSSTSGQTGAQASIFDVAARDIARLKAVIGVVSRHGFGEVLQRSPLSKFVIGKIQDGEASGASKAAPPAVRLRRLLEDLGPTYIKFGQILSMRPDLLPLSYIEALEELQDQAPVVPVAEIKATITRGLGRPVEELFASFDEVPLATASIGQTHRARTHDGKEVVVKVQRPGIEQVMRGDLDLLYMLAKLLEVGIEELQLIRPADTVAQFEKALVRELDFTEELRNLQTARSYLLPDRAITMPEPFPELSCRTVLTMEFFAGQSLRKLSPRSDQAKHAVTELLHSALHQVLIDGFFHGDPHMGNILISEQQQVCLIDYGLVGRLSKEQQREIISLLIAISTKDATAIAYILLRMGTPLERVNIAAFKAEIKRIMDRVLTAKSLVDIETEELAASILEAAQRFRIGLAPEYAILVKAATTVEGVVRSLYPDVDIMEIATPILQRLMAQRFTPEQLMSDSFSGLLGLSSIFRQLPSQFEQIMHDAETGNIRVRAITPGLDLVAPMLHQLAGRLALTVFAATMTIASVLLLALADPQRVSGAVTVLFILGAIFSWGWLSLWHLFGRGKPIRLARIMQFVRR
jgi:ubiquinone biosynthesis protein